MVDKLPRYSDNPFSFHFTIEDIYNRSSAHRSISEDYLIQVLDICLFLMNYTAFMDYVGMGKFCKFWLLKIIINIFGVSKGGICLHCGEK